MTFVRCGVDIGGHVRYTVYRQTDTTGDTMTATKISRYQAIEVELGTFAPADDVQRFSDLCDEQADLYAAIAAVDYDLARTL